MERSMLLCTVAVLAMAAPAAATTFDMAYQGSVSFQPPQYPGTIRLDETGTGRLTLDTSLSQVTLASGLSDFSFTTDLLETMSPFASPAKSFAAGSVTYGLADLTSLDATIAHGMVTSLSFQTKAKSLSYGGASSVSFYDVRGAGGSAFKSGGPTPLGQIAVEPATAAVPEPASWATMLLGFGIIGAVLRRRRPRAHCPA